MVNNKESHTDLINRLKDSKEADLYLSSILEKCKNLDKEEADKLLHKALRNIAESRPQDVNIDVNENSLKLSALLCLLHFVSRKLM